MPIDVSTVTHSVQLSMAPVFFLTAVAGMIAAVAGRLARIIDRGRQLDEWIRSSQDRALILRSLRELAFLRRRGRLANFSIALLTLCGFLIGLTIVFLFLGETWRFNGYYLAVFCFLFGVVSFIAALALFLWETMMATQLLDFEGLEIAAQAQLELENIPKS